MSDSFLKRHWRKLALVVSGLLALLLITLGGISIVLNTQVGTQWAISKLSENLNGDPAQSVSFGGVSGTLFRGLSFEKVDIENSSGTFFIEGVGTAWNPFSLLSGQFILFNLELAKLTVNLQSQESTEPPQKFTSITNPLPLGAVIESLQIDQLEISSNGNKQTIQDIQLTAELTEQQLSLKELALNSNDVTLTGNVALGFADFQPIQAILFWSHNTAINNQPEELAGQLDLQGDLRSVQIEHQLFSPFTIQSSGVFIPGLFDKALDFDLSHSTDSLVLPLQSQPPLELADVELVSKGNFTELSIDFQAILLNELFPPISLTSQASYQSSRLDVSSYSLSISDDLISGAAILDWSEEITLSGVYTAELENLEYFAELPEQLDLSLLFSSGTFETSIQDDVITGELVVQQLRGQLGDYPLQGQGAIKFGDGALEINQLQLITQSNELFLNGVYTNELDFSWEVNANSLSEILVDVSGELTGKGNLTGEISAFDINGQFSGRNLAYLDTSIDQVDLSFERIANQIQSQLDVTSLIYADGTRTEKLSALNLSISGTESAHQITLNANSDYGDIEMELAGSLPSLSNPLWQGRLVKASAATVLGDWATNTSSSLTVSGSSINIRNSCWNQQETTVCASMQRGEDGTLQVNSRMQSYPLNVLNEQANDIFSSRFTPSEDQLILLPKLPAGVTVDGVVHGNLSISMEPDSQPAFDFQLSGIDARLLIDVQKSMTEENLESTSMEETPVPPQEYSMEALTLSGNSINGLWQLDAAASFLSQNIDDSGIDVRGNLDGELSVDAEQSLTGNIVAELEDLRWLEAFVPEFSNIDGALNGQVNLDGNINSPEITGTLKLENAAVSFNRLGISLTDISANIASADSESIQFTGSANSNSGSIQYEGQLNDALTESRVLSAQLMGSDFQLVNIDDLQLNVSPELMLSANSEKVELTGNLDLPVFNLTLEELPESAIDVSRDVVIVNYPSSRPELARSLATSDTRVFDIPLSGNIDISLGDEVSFTGFGMKTKLAGNLNIQQSVTGSNLTYGELNLVDGEYRIYGRSLVIQQGKFLFFGAYDNPGIDIKATREVNEQTVGVLMNGTLKNINSQLFSTPALEDNDIISVLVTGKSFSQIGQQEGDGDAILNAITNLGLSRSKGLTNQVRSKLGLDVLAVSNSGNINNSVLTIGKYITPGIFVRYGIGLFDSQSKVAVDYTLTDRIKLQAESGEFQSVDIIYSVEQ